MLQCVCLYTEEEEKGGFFVGTASKENRKEKGKKKIKDFKEENYHIEIDITSYIYVHM